jgi:hypothetical protein
MGPQTGCKPVLKSRNQLLEIIVFKIEGLTKLGWHKLKKKVLLSLFLKVNK